MFVADIISALIGQFLKTAYSTVMPSGRVSASENEEKDSKGNIALFLKIEAAESYE